MTAAPKYDDSLIIDMQPGDECIADPDAVTRPSVIASPLVVPPRASLWQRFLAWLQDERAVAIRTAERRVLEAATAHYIAEREWLVCSGTGVAAEVIRLNWRRCQQALDARVAELIRAREVM